MRVEGYLELVLPSAHQFPQPLHRAMRHGALGGGKRLRPLLCLAAAQAAAGNWREGALRPAIALELIHAYSLIHDDLPAMDDDDLRRGQPTCHIIYGEAMAILAGDGLQCLAFEILTGCRPATLAQALGRELSRAAGTPDGMVAGQAADIWAEGRRIKAVQNPKSRLPRLPAARPLLELIHRRKTGALLRAALVMGGLAAGADPARIRDLRRIGADIGLAFQIQDDLLDRQASTGQLGKTAGKDQAQGKLTYPGVYGEQAAHKQASRLSRRALRVLDGWGKAALPLRELVESMAERQK